MGDTSADNVGPAPRPDKLIRSMAHHRAFMEEYLQHISVNSKILSQEKYEQIVMILKNPSVTAEELGMPHQKMAKFRWWVADREFDLMNDPLFNLNDVVCIPLTPKKKKKVSQSIYRFSYIILFNCGKMCQYTLPVEVPKGSHVTQISNISPVT